MACLHVVMDEEWNHHQYATRDLATPQEGKPRYLAFGASPRACLALTRDRKSVV